MSQRNFIIAAGSGAAALLLVWAFLVRPARKGIDEDVVGVRNLLARRAGYFRANGSPIGEARAELGDEKRRLEGLKGSVGAVALSLPADLDPGGDSDDGGNADNGDGGGGDGDGDGAPPGLNYYQMKRSELTARAKGGGLSFAKMNSPLGLPMSVAEDEVPDYLARIAVARRFLDAAELAGVSAVLRAEHPAIRTGPSSGDRVAEELPMRIVAAADEKSLIRLVYELSQPARFLALKGIKIEVKDAATGRFEATLDLAGVRVVRKEAAPAAGPVPATLGAPVEAEPGQALPARTRRRRTF